MQTALNLFVARQPILDATKRTVGYELLFRSGAENVFTASDADMASGRVVHDSLLEFGLGALVGSRKAYINITRQTLLSELYTMLPRDQVVIELLESVSPTPEVIDACRALKKNGYTLALDDFTYRPETEPLLEVADIVKVDILATQEAERAALVQRLARYRVTLLAEKVETSESFRETLKRGYALFQGYFFHRPEMVATSGIPRLKINYLRFLEAVNRPEINFTQLEQVIKREVSLSVKLLRYLNSAALGLRQEVTSIKHALVLLGERPLRQWASVVALVDLGDDKPAELVITGLSRARFCEIMGRHAGYADRELALFMMGVLSVGEALLGHPLEAIMKEISVAPDVREALEGGDTALGRLLRLAIAYERGDWDAVDAQLGEIEGARELVATAYRDAVKWASDSLTASA